MGKGEETEPRVRQPIQVRRSIEKGRGKEKVDRCYMAQVEAGVTNEK